MADQMTTPDPTLAARLDAMLEPALQYDSVQDEFHGALDTALRSGQLITLSDHLAALQAAVAKAVEAERARIIAAMRNEADDCPCDEDAVVIADCADLIEADFSYDDCEKLKIAREAAAIRARKGDAL